MTNTKDFIQGGHSLAPLLTPKDLRPDAAPCCVSSVKLDALTAKRKGEILWWLNSNDSH